MTQTASNKDRRNCMTLENITLQQLRVCNDVGVLHRRCTVWCTRLAATCMLACIAKQIDPVASCCGGLSPQQIQRPRLPRSASRSAQNTKCAQFAEPAMLDSCPRVHTVQTLEANKRPRDVTKGLTSSSRILIHAHPLRTVASDLGHGSNR